MSDDAEKRAGDAPTDRADATATGGRPCPMCNEVLYRRHCKYVCPNHGVVMDCADTFHLQRE